MCIKFISHKMSSIHKMCFINACSATSILYESCMMTCLLLFLPQVKLCAFRFSNKLCVITIFLFFKIIYLCVDVSGLMSMIKLNDVILHACQNI